MAISSACSTADTDSHKWRGYVERCLGTLVEHGTDRYGPVQSPLIMAVIDVRTLESPEKPELLDSLVRLENRLHRRGERGSNFWYDQKTLKCMYRLSRLIGDAKYATAADSCAAYALKNCRKSNGLLVWGSHIYWDCYKDEASGDDGGKGPHEILVFQPEWEEMYRVNPVAVREEIEGIWKWHVIDKKTGYHNRHDDGRRGFDFAFSGGSLILAFAFMHKATQEPRWLERARLVSDWHWNARNKKTGLTPDTPGSRNRYDGRHSFTNQAGLFASQLLGAYEMTADTYFRDVAIAYIKTFDKYGWDPKSSTFHAMLKLDGTPIPARAKASGYDRWSPTGHVNVWRTSIFSYEFTLAAAQAAIYAWEQSAKEPGERDPELLRVALRWAGVVEGALPPHTGRRWKEELEAAMPAVIKTGGAYAEDYGRAISFFVHVYRATKDPKHLRLAEGLAGEAVEKLFENGLFKGHPAKPYYETTNGVGLLLWALLELDAPLEELPGAF